MRPSKRGVWEPWTKRSDEVIKLVIDYLRDGKKHRYSELFEQAVNKHISPPTLVKHLEKLCARGVLTRDKVSSREVYYQLSARARFGDVEIQLIDFKNKLARMLDNPKEFSTVEIIYQLIRDVHNMFFWNHRGSLALEDEFISIMKEKIVVARLEDNCMKHLKDALEIGAFSGRCQLEVQSYSSGQSC